MCVFERERKREMKTILLWQVMREVERAWTLASSYLLYADCAYDLGKWNCVASDCGQDYVMKNIKKFCRLNCVRLHTLRGRQLARIEIC